MSEEEKLVAGAEAAADYLKGVTVVKAELRDSQYWTYKTEMFENEYLEQEERTVVAGVYDLEGGEWVARYSAKELWEMYKAGEAVPEKMVFDGEIVEKVWDTESALGRAQEATYKGVEYPAGVEVWENAAGETVLVDWAYYPGGAHDLMSVVETPDGRLVVLQPVGTEVKYDLSGVSKAELDQVFATIRQGDNNKDFESVISQPEGKAIVVMGLQSTTKGYWEGSESVDRQNAIVQFDTASPNKEFTADKRKSDVVVLVTFGVKGPSVFKQYLTWRGGKYVTTPIVYNLAVGDQTSTSYINFEDNFVRLLRSLGKLWGSFGVTWGFFE
ncbi:MAG: hypothetical protein HND47_10210 [Chloroflexi bacterium]|nr:hypothetical protein [Chloroflexota bacterium]